MAIDDEDFRRRRALSEICGVSRHGTVDGVEFDLRHELLEPGEWQMNTIGLEPPRFETAFDPFIWFPWYGEFSQVRLRGEANRTPDCIINVGDKITIRDVQQQYIGDGFDHAHDSELRYALLSVIRSNGKTEAIQTPVRFNGITSIFTEGSAPQFFDKIYRRICQQYDVPSLGEVVMYQVGEKGGRFAYVAAFHAELLLRQLRKLTDSGQSDDVCNASIARHIADEAVYLGYLWAKAEAEIKLKPLVKSALRAKAGAASGGSKSGAVRRQKRAASWEPIARQMAKDIRAQNPTFSQDKVAEEISSGWQARNCDPPGHPTLKSLISRMEQARELPKRRRI